MPALTADAERVVAWLRTVRFCEGLDSEQLAAIASETLIRPFAAGETLASAGDEVTEFWILIEGELDSFLTDPRGREKWLGTIRQGETVGEIAILEQAPTRPVRYTARTHGTLLFAPAALLHEWVKTYPQMMQNLFHTLSDRFKVVAGVAARSLPSPRLGIVATSPRGCVLAGRLAARLLAAGERLGAWAGQPTSLTSTGSWPDALPIQELAAERYSAVAATCARGRSANRGLVARLQRSDGIQATTGMRRGAVAARTARRGECEPGR